VLLKSALTNLMRFPIRRFDMTLGVAYKEDIAKVRALLFAAAERNPLGLEDPKPLFVFLGYGDSDLQMQFSVWCKRENFVDLKNSLYTDIKLTFDKYGVEIPFPQRTVVASSDGKPIPVTLHASPKPESPATGT
jgi:small-conductance mechanosensitive channel